MVHYDGLFDLQQLDDESKEFVGFFSMIKYIMSLYQQQRAYR